MGKVELSQLLRLDRTVYDDIVEGWMENSNDAGLQVEL